MKAAKATWDVTGYRLLGVSENECYRREDS